MTITRISSLKKYGIFRDFTWPTGLSDFSRYNLIYGWNGSGKTTLSRLIRDLEYRRYSSNGQVTIRIDANEISGDDFPHVKLPVRVFNRNFVNESVFPIGGGNVPPIYVIGKENVEKQKQIEQIKAERASIESEFATARSRKLEAVGTFERFCQDRARTIKDMLRSSGQNPYNNYDKSDYRNRAQQMDDDDNAEAHRMNESDRNSLLAQIKATPRRSLMEVSYKLPSLQDLADEVIELLASTIVSSAIQSLKDDPALAEWTRYGLGLHKERQTEKCLFCEQALPQERLSAIEAHFSAEYEQFLSKIDNQIEQFESIKQHASELKLPNRAVFYDDLASEYEFAEQEAQATIEAIQVYINALIKTLGEKKGQVFNRMTLNVSMPVIESEIIDRINEVIRKHNQACNNFQSRIDDARNRLALYIIAEDIAEFIQLRNAVVQAETDIRAAVKNTQELTEKIQQLEQAIIQHQQPADEMNQDLHKYLGHCEIQIEVQETGYIITRNKVSADMLSEGEMTAIALLYFLKSLEDRQFDLGNGIVVLDDPVSSLDQNALFAAFGYIRARTQMARQVFILTHNFLFFKLVKEWFRILRRPDKNACQMYMLECAFDEHGRYTVIRTIDPLLKEFDSEYHYLFSKIYHMATEPPFALLEAYYHAPNIARRVIEMFLAFRFPEIKGRGQLWSQMQKVQYDESNKSRIYRYMQTHAHRDAIGEIDEDLTLLGESRTILNNVLAFMKAADSDHVSRMISLVESTNEEVSA